MRSVLYRLDWGWSARSPFWYAVAPRRAAVLSICLAGDRVNPLSAAGHGPRAWNTQYAANWNASGPWRGSRQAAGWREASGLDCWNNCILPQ